MATKMAKTVMAARMIERLRVRGFMAGMVRALAGEQEGA
jgi:hypothetical protein